MEYSDSRRIKEIRNNTAKMADAFTRIADALERLADRKTENCSEKPNNCGTCKHWEYDAKYKWWHCPLQDNGMYECRYEPKDEPQTDCPWK